ncbi:MAG: protein kinase, partial [Gemmatimonadales bacterium]
ADGFLFYVMPYVDGETLRERLDRETQLGVEEAVRIASEVADALDYAHRQGVIHRDIKPENILLHDGRPMVADFGIALALSAAGGGRMTETGLSLGTPHYMSPEQATAEKELSGRSDVYSLGSVLYEMLTGDPPHTGSSAQQIIMKILTDRARPVTELRRSVPANVAAAVARSLEKLPADRFTTPRDFADALADPSFRVGGPGPGAAAGPAVSDWRSRLAVPALVAAVLALAVAGWSLTRPAPAPPVSRYTVRLPDHQPLDFNAWSRIAVSPDGELLVYRAGGETGSILVVRRRDQLEARPLPGTEGGYNPSFSPDGTRVAFMAVPPGAGSNAVRTVPIAGGPPATVVDSLVGAPGVAWGVDGFIYFDVTGPGPLMKVPENGGAAVAATTLDTESGERQHVWPDPLPNGRGLLFTVNYTGPGRNGDPSDRIAVLDLATGEHRVLVSGVYARYAESGHLVYVTSEGTLMAAPFDAEGLEVQGEPAPVAEGVSVRGGTGGVDLTLSATGTLWYSVGTSGFAIREVVRISSEGTASVVDPDLRGELRALALSPEGSRLALQVRDVNGPDIWVKELDRGPFSRLTSDGASWSPRWHPDGDRIVFVSSSDGQRQLGTVVADGSRPPESLDLDGGRIATSVWGPEGDWLVFVTSRFTGSQDLYGVRPGSDSVPQPLVATDAQEWEPEVSPDGRWLAYVADTNGRPEVYVRPFPNASDALFPVSTAGGIIARWSADGGHLYYITEDGVLMDARVRTGDTFVVGERRALFTLDPLLDWGSLAVAPEPGTFYFLRTVSEAEGQGLVVVENFFEELRARFGG